MSTIESILPDVKTATIRERADLPIGSPGDGGGALVSRSLSVRPWTLVEETDLGELRSENRDVNVSQYAGIVLAYMYRKFGPWDFDIMEMPERRAHISGLTMPDVFFAYIYLRIKAMGPGFKMEVTCSRCSNEFPFVVNLEDTEVRFVEDPGKVFWEYELKNPFQLRGHEVTRLKMGPTRWSNMEATPAGALNLGIAKRQIITGSLYGFPGLDDMVLAPHELDQLTKIDIEALTNMLDELSLGPDMSIEGKCPKCQRGFKESIDWSYEAFFGTSSQ